MFECNSPLIICRLTDESGKLLNPYATNAITFSSMCSSKKCVRSTLGSEIITLLIKGYIVVYVEGKNISPPIPFIMRKQICISTPDGAFLDFQVKYFNCSGVPVIPGMEAAEVLITINIDTNVRSYGWTDATVLSVDPPEKIVISAKRVYDCVCFRSSGKAVYDLLIKATTAQYNALTNGTNNYTNTDEIIEYGHTGILSPNDVSFYNLYINGVLQPTENYDISAGNLDLLTMNIPPKDAPVILSFVTFGKNHGKDIHVTNNTFISVSTGTKRVFTNSDVLPEYSPAVIPSPDDISYFNLFINGALQPQINYTVKQGILELTTLDIPPENATIILESLTVKDSDNKLLHAEVYQYNAYSMGNKIYTDSNEITMYGSEGISNPQFSSYNHLFVNGVIQPNINYSVAEGRLTLDTLDAPNHGVPVTLQFVRVFVS